MNETQRSIWYPQTRHLVAFAILLTFALGSAVKAVRSTTDAPPPPTVPSSVPNTAQHSSANSSTEPSTEREVLFTSADGTSIAGSLSLPSGPGPFPAVIAISGAGVQDRDGMARDPADLRMWPDAFTRAGVALLRTDDRGIGGSGGNSLSATFDDLADDTEAAIAFLQRQPEIAPERIGLLGASMGTQIAAIVAAQRGYRNNVAFLILKSGPGLLGRDIVFHQLATLLRAEDLPEKTIQEILDVTREAIRRLMAPAINDEERREKLRPLIVRQRDLQRTDPFFGPRASASSIEAELDAVLSPSYREALNYDPAPNLRRVRCPVLVLHGELDLQVHAGRNLPAIEAALAVAPTDDVTVALFPKLNHFLQETETGKMSEYATARLSPDPPHRAATWVSERFAERRPK